MRELGKKLGAITGAAVVTFALVAGPVSGLGESSRSTTIGTICTGKGKSTNQLAGASTTETTNTTCSVAVNARVKYNDGVTGYLGWTSLYGSFVSQSSAPNAVVQGSYHKVTNSSQAIVWLT